MQLIDIKLDYNHLAYFDTVLQECLHQQSNQTMIQELSQNVSFTMSFASSNFSLDDCFCLMKTRRQAIGGVITIFTGIIAYIVQQN